MYRIPIDSNPYQEQTFSVTGEMLRLTIRYNSIADTWVIDVYNVDENRFDAQGLALVVGVPLMFRSSVKYFFLLSDESNVGLDPTGGSDLGSRCLLYIANKSEAM